MKQVLSLAFIILSTSINAQVYFGLNSGYGIGLGGIDFYTENYSVSGISSYGSYSFQKARLGSGFYQELHVGYKYKEHLNFELRVGYFTGKQGPFESKVDDSWYTRTTRYQFTSSSLRLMPTIAISFGKSDFMPYTRFGLCFGFFNQLEHLITGEISTSQDPYTDKNLVYSKGMGLGACHSIGLSKTFNKKIILSLELNTLLYFWAPKKSRYTSYTSKGYDYFSNATTSVLEAIYVDEISVNEPQDPNSPRKELKTTYNYSSIGLQLSISYLFGR